MPNIGQHLCVPIYSHMKCKFWVYQDTEAQGAWAVSWNISIKKDYNQIRSRALGIHFWPACLSIYLSGKLLLRNSATLIKIGILDQFEEESDTVVFPKVWHHPYFHHVMGWVPVNAYTVIMKDFVTGYGSGHIYLWPVSGMLCCCMRICQASSINTTWDKESFIPLACAECRDSLPFSGASSILPYCIILFIISGKKYRTLNTIMWFILLKNLWFITLQLQMFPASLAVECWVAG